MHLVLLPCGQGEGDVAASRRLPDRLEGESLLAMMYRCVAVSVLWKKSRAATWLPWSIADRSAILPIFRQSRECRICPTRTGDGHGDCIYQVQVV